MTREWYFQSMGQELGPLTASELKSKVTSGQVQPDTLIRKGTEGKWIYGGSVKGLFATPPEPPALVPASVKRPSSATIPVPGRSKADSSDRHAAVMQSAPSSSTHAAYIPVHEDDSNSHEPSVEFYDFVGFREAISPVLHDAAKQYISDCGITMSQLNRRALASFIKRPELASDLAITEVAALPQSVNEKSNRDGRFPLSDREKIEVATFRFTLFNSSHGPIEVAEGAFLPESIEERSYDSILGGRHAAIDHTGHFTARLRPLVVGKSIRMKLEITVPPQSTRDFFVWFHDHPKPSLLKIRGQMIVGHGLELAMSESFTITLHGDSPSPVS